MPLGVWEHRSDTKMFPVETPDEKGPQDEPSSGCGRTPTSTPPHPPGVKEENNRIVKRIPTDSEPARKMALRRRRANATDQPADERKHPKNNLIIRPENSRQGSGERSIWSAGAPAAKPFSPNDLTTGKRPTSHLMGQHTNSQ